MVHIHRENLSLFAVGKTSSLQEELFGNVVWKQCLEAVFGNQEIVWKTHSLCQMHLKQTARYRPEVICEQCFETITWKCQ